MSKFNDDSSENEVPEDVSRRSLLGGIATIGGAVAVSSAIQGCADSSEHVESKAAPDVIVIGGGLAGCVAARELAHKGHKVTLVEAQNRLGGRTFTSEFAGVQYEVGALMLSWKQPLIWSEVVRYGMEIEPIPGSLAPERCYWIAGGESKSGSPEEFFELFVPAVHKFFDDVAATFPFPYEVLTNRSLVEKLDQLSVEDRLNERFASDPVARDFADNWASVPLARQGSEVSLAATMALTSAFGGVEASLEGTGFRLKEGTSSLINNIVEDGGFDYRLGAPVASISQNNSGATVVLRGGETLSAEKVILTTPVNTYDGIEFNPPLNAAKQIVSKGKMAGGHGSHINAKLKGKSPPILAVAPSDMPLGLLLTTDVFEDSTIVDGYGPDADLFDGSDPEEVQEVIRQWIPDAEVLETVSYRWDLDPYSQGTWAGYKPGVLSKYFEGLRESEGHVYFASGDSATAFRGFMEGAIESGVRVSRDVHRSLAGIKET